MAPSQHKNIPSRASLPRRTTRGPLDDLDPLNNVEHSPSSARDQSIKQHERIVETYDTSGNLLDNADAANIEAPAGDRNLSFVLDRTIYHPVSQLDVPQIFRKPLSVPLPFGAGTQKVLDHIDDTLGQCDFASAAHLAVSYLTSGLVRPDDHNTIFRLLSIRYSCLELLGQSAIAAQETKSLEDLTSDFYYDAGYATEEEIAANNGLQPVPLHIMPFELRIQALRLQGIAFSDTRRYVATLYELGMECREHITSPYVISSDRQIWIDRLTSLTTHVVNALIDLGEFECAHRMLSSTNHQEADMDSIQSYRNILLLLKMGKTEEAAQQIGDLPEGTNQILMHAILLVAEDDTEQAGQLLEQVRNDSKNDGLAVLAKQNLAIVHLYQGRIDIAQKILEDLVQQGNSFASLTAGLATIYELTSDRAQERKVQLMDSVAARGSLARAFTGTDFKL